MLVRKAYKNNEKSPENQRRYVIPVTGTEQNQFIASCIRVVGKDPNGDIVPISYEEWPCSYMHPLSESVGLPGTAYAFRFNTSKTSDERLINHVRKCLMSHIASDTQIDTVPHDTIIKYHPPHHEDQW